ncbi:hypothetical protein N657DRAFT_653248 [Parathielavia appendiculata]|uniref:Uncharacterized protein n=1 Tax=Parathielavia appendiculata TaxID=2587402 RepID=A0AAN6Z6H1_9PEZI|nr:hypothetical protein N657DRAFT_653248 [Parathielavia appendiculata]
MSVRKEVVHPDLKLDALSRRAQDDSSSNSESDSDEDGAALAPQKVVSPRTVSPHNQTKAHSSFSSCRGRPNRRRSPSAEELGEHGSGLENLFFWGKRECSISNDGKDPNEVLGILTVCKGFYFIGVHIFYGLNTFAFSSLRVRTHMELLLQGHLYLTAPADERGKYPFSRRSYPLSWLADVYRLKTLVIHINESGKMYVRSGYENKAAKRLLAAKTAGQPNQRMTRSLRSVQGVDYICQLRGMQWVRFYDFNKALEARRSVRDVTNKGTLPKPPKRQEHSELENLEPLLPAGDDRKWKPSDDDWKLVKSIFIDSDGRCSYDDLRLRGSIATRIWLRI